MAVPTPTEVVAVFQDAQFVREFDMAAEEDEQDESGEADQQ